MKIAIYPGSFDPITNGHLDIIQNSATMFDKVIVAVASNINKKGILSTEEKVSLIKKCTINLPNIEVDSFEGLTCEYAKKKGSSILIRGLRTAVDFEYELQIAQTNHSLCPDLKTVFLVANPENSFISSSMVKEILHHKGDISKFVPTPVFEYLSKKDDI